MGNDQQQTISPATGQVIGTYTQNQAGEIAALVAKARLAQAGWAAWPFRARAACLKRVAAYLAGHVDEIAAIISQNNGKTRVDALATELVPAILGIRYYRTIGKRLCRPRRIGPGSLLLANKRSRLVQHPYGVVGIISPWNYPFSIPFSEVVMALLAGNAVVLKVASDSLAVGEALAACFAAAGLSADVFNYIRLPGSVAGPALIDGGIDKLFFTGSTEVGKQLMARAAQRLLPLVLELGGNDAAIVTQYANLERAAAGIIWAGFSNAGQSCGGAQRILVQRSVLAEFSRRLTARMGQLRIGDGANLDSDIGCMSSQKQKRVVEEQIKRTLELGGKILAQGSLGQLPADACWLAPTVIIDAPANSPLLREEVFGPVIALIPYDGDDEAIRLANDSSLGLTASVWSDKPKQAAQLARRIRAGAVMVNDHLMSHGLAETPWGGFGESGLGRTHGEAGFKEMLQTQVIVGDIMPGVRKNIWWHPYSEKVYGGLRAIVDLSAGRGFGRRLGALLRLSAFFFRYWDKK